MSLHIVDQPSNVTVLPTAAPPSFEGQEVMWAKVRLTSVTNLEIDSDFQIDDTVQLGLTGRVTAVGHVVDAASGAIVRVHTIRIIDATTLDIEHGGGSR